MRKAQLAPPAVPLARSRNAASRTAAPRTSVETPGRSTSPEPAGPRPATGSPSSQEHQVPQVTPYLQLGTPTERWPF